MFQDESTSSSNADQAIFRVGGGGRNYEKDKQLNILHTEVADVLAIMQCLNRQLEESRLTAELEHLQAIDKLGEEHQEALKYDSTEERNRYLTLITAEYEAAKSKDPSARKYA